MTIYKIETKSGVMYADADLAQASASIHVYFGDDPFCKHEDDSGISWDSTSYQTADARHSDDRMASLVAEHYDMGDVISVEVHERPISMTRMDIAKLDSNLLADLDGKYQLFDVDDPEQTVSNQYYQLIYCPDDERAGIVLCGSGSSGHTSWTDCDSAEDAMRRYLNNEMTG